MSKKHVSLFTDDEHILLAAWLKVKCQVPGYDDFEYHAVLEKFGYDRKRMLCHAVSNRQGRQQNKA